MLRLPLSILLSPALASAAAGAPLQDPALAWPRSVAIVVYPGVELLDFAGPGEVFSSTDDPRGHAFTVFTVAETHDPVTSQGFVHVTPQYSIEDCPRVDVVVVPGGQVPSAKSKLGAWVAARALDCEVLMSVCNGAVLLGEVGLLAGLEVTTHRSALESLALIEPTAKVFTNRRFVDNGRIVTAAGVSAGIDGALQVVSRLCGEESAWQTARYMEYDWRPDEIAKLHAQPGRPVEQVEGINWVASVKKLGVQQALVKLRALANPPTEQRLNGWGYTLSNAGRAEDALVLFELIAAAFPTSANALDSWSEALEQHGDRERALSTAKDSLARLERDTALDPNRRELLHNSATSRIARLSDRSARELSWICPPCDSACDRVAYLEGGRCPGCPMDLVKRDAAENGRGTQD